MKVMDCLFSAWEFIDIKDDVHVTFNGCSEVFTNFWCDGYCVAHVRGVVSLVVVVGDDMGSVKNRELGGNASKLVLRTVE